MESDFLRAACDGDMATLERSPELACQRADGATPLHFAAIEGQIEAARWLLEHGAGLEAVDDEYGSTPVAWANESGRREMVEFLLSRGARITAHQAAGFGCLDRLKSMAAADPTVLEQEEVYGTLLHAACIWGQPEVAEWLLAQGADPLRESPQGLTPLQIAANQAKHGMSHTPIVSRERKAEIERDCARIVERLRTACGA